MVNEQSFEKHMEKQMGCMTGFLHIFDRHQILSGKRHYSAKRLPPSPVFDTTSESEKSDPASAEISRELTKSKQPSPATSQSPDRSNRSPSTELRSPLPMFEMNEGTKCSWKFGKEAPRLSLDSRATTDAKGSLHPMEICTAASILAAANRCDGNESDESQQHRSPSVIARLMGLEPLPDSSSYSEPELRRSASESRVSRDLFQSRFISERSNFSPNKPTKADDNLPRFSDPINYLLKNAGKVDTPKAFNRGGEFHSPSSWNAPRHRKSFFDSGDFFPEPKQASSICGETENRLKLRGIEEPSKDLDTLKQILEALQLKGLLHSRKHSEQHQIHHRTFIYDDSPIVVMKPSRLPNSTPFSRRMANSPPFGGNHSLGCGRRNYGLAGENSPSMSPRRDRNVRSAAQTGRSPSPTTTNRSEGNTVGRRSNSLSKPKPLSVETQRRTNSSTENRRLSPVQSPRRTGRDAAANTRSPRNSKSMAEINRKEKKTVAAEYETSSISGSSITTSTDIERCKSEVEYKEGRGLLERCDKLLHSIAEMSATDMQSSPVSVLDSALYEDESSTPSPITTRRNIDFKDECGELDEERWSTEIVSSQDSDFVYVSNIMRASHFLPQGSDVFLLLEKQQYLKGKDTCKVSRLKRKLIFDTVHEILNRNRQLPPWKVASWGHHGPSLDKVWSEFQRARERARDATQDLFDTICGVLKKDLAGDGISGWEDFPFEMSEAILDIERFIFKDLICEAIQDLGWLESSNKATLPSLPRRKLVFSNKLNS